MRSRNLILSILFLTLIVFTLAGVSASYSDNYYSNYRVYQFGANYNTPSYEEKAYHETAYSPYGGYSETTSYTKKITGYDIAYSYSNRDVYISPGYYRAGDYIKNQYSKPRVFIEQRQTSCDIYYYSRDCYNQPSGFRANPTYDYNLYGKDSYTKPYYYQPYQTKNGYYNWDY